LEPANPLYRNNIATVLVDQEKFREAFDQLRQVHNEAAAYYNLGYLLTKKGKNQAALHSFSCALQVDPSMGAARQWVDHLQRTMAQERLAQHPSGAGVKVVSTPPQQEMDAVPPEEPQPQRLPPTTPTTAWRSAGSQAMPGISYDNSSSGDAPLPPSSSNPSLRPLPRVR
jgi:hypothetical protein